MLPYETDAETYIAKTYKTQFERMNALHDVVVGMMTVPTWRPKRPKQYTPYVLTTIVGLLVKALKTFRAIQILLERGLYEDANALMRVLFETTMAGLYILQRDSQQRSQVFHAHSLSQFVKMLNHWKQTKGIKRKTKKAHIDATKTGITRLMQGVPSTMDHEVHWSGKKGKLISVTKELKVEIMYALLFRFTSSVTHATDVGAQFDVDPQTEEFIWRIDPRVNDLDGPCITARQLLWVLAERINRTFGLGFTAVLASHKVMKVEAVQI